MMIQKEEFVSDANSLVESVSKRRLVNILNYVNFKEKSVVVNLKRLKGVNRISVRAVPEPCFGENVRLTWSENPPSDIDTGYEFIDFFVDKGSRVLIVDGASTDVSRAGITILLPERCRSTSRRQTERFGSAPVHATLSRSRSEAKGLLQDFGGGFLKVRLAARDGGFLSKGKGKLPLQVALRLGETTIYESKAMVKRRIARGDNIDLVLSLIPFIPDAQQDRPEVALDPPLIAIYRHPLSDRMIRLGVLRASYNTFVVREDPKHEALLSGLVLPELKIDFGTGDSAQCSARVVGGEADAWLLSILDMTVFDQRKLFSFIEKETGKSSGASAVIDPDDLIEFFFEAGFVYPEKYAGFAHSRNRLKEILSRLYIDRPSISQHFVQYDKGIVQGHICMVRFYECAWVVHHHTAIGGGGAGSAVLAQIFRYIYSYGHLPSTGMEYMMTYYRPENRFPNRVLGGFARSLQTPSLCSVDSFAYTHLHFGGSGKKGRAEKAYHLVPAGRKDLLKLKSFYEGVSGGLTLKAFGLDAAYHNRETIDLGLEFEKAGLRRKKSFFSLTRGGKLKAVMMASDSDSGLNMSNLMKCIHVFVIDEEGLPLDQLMSQLNGLSSLYDEREIPVLLFPVSYANDQRAAYEKTYDLLVVRASIVKQFAQFTERITDRAARRRYRGLSSDREGETSEQ